ncbi:TTKRSYEDQ domain-containing protein [Nephila pilipes]|uniref:TTKRSYEDQ domain-containing protein n=1 Tax=Nephila pilipes TaxID=299642 RepID=A0A8X6QZD3_NEPPI|nr:TTKRSYEDQ domain-containing protein [Nephila pilipes]
MIMACELESSFKDIWQYKIRYEFLNSGSAKKCGKIQDAFHLARAIVYMSQRKAGRDCKIPNDLRDSGQLSHFHMNRTLHEHSIAFLCALFPDGIQQLLLEQNRNKDVVRWENESLTEEHTARYLTLHRGQKLYLKMGDAEQDVNWPFQRIRDETYVLSPKQQNVMNQIKETKMAKEALWKCKVAKGKAEREVLKTK